MIYVFKKIKMFQILNKTVILHIIYYAKKFEYDLIEYQKGLHLNKKLPLIRFISFVNLFFFWMRNMCLDV